MSEAQPYIVSARKYRPANFNTVVGQKALTTTLKNAISEKRLAQAYLFCGPRGVGKTSCARIFAKSINCLNPRENGDACCECESCKAIEKGNSFNLVELDAASNNSVDDIRSITEQVNVPPQEGRYRVFIIDEVHMLSNSAFNAFLKTLEEPPKNVVFILATTEKHKVIPTILSRCQIYDFKRITIEDMTDHLAYVAEQEGIKADRRALGIISQKADGAMRDALSIFDQVAASSRGNITYASTIENLNVLDYDYYFRLADAFRNTDAGTALLIYKEIRDKGFDSLFFVNGLANHIRDLMVALDPRTQSLLETSEELAKKYHEQSKMFPVEWYYAALKLLNDCDFNYRLATDKRLLVELTLIKLTQLLKPATPPFDQTDESKKLGKIVMNVPEPSISSVKKETEKEEMKPVENTSNKPESKESIVNFTPEVIQKPSAESINRPASSTLKTTGRPGSFRINTAGKTSESAFSTYEKKTETFSDEAFMQAWHSFINSNPSLHILVNAMRNATPKRSSDNTYEIIVDHPAQQQAFDLSMNKLIEFLRKSLSNDLLSLKIKLNDAPAADKKVHPKEMLRQVANANPAMAKFLKDIDAELIS